MKSDWIFLSKGGQDQYINMMARGAGGSITNTDDFDFDASDRAIVLRGILKHKIMQRCWKKNRDFYYMDTGYFGNTVSRSNPNGWKLWHRIVKNDLQHTDIQTRPPDRLARLNIQFSSRRQGRRIVIAAPDDKPCRFYGIDRKTWLDQTLQTLRSVTDRPVQIRERSPVRSDRVHQDPLSRVLADDVHALVTFNSAAAIESIVSGVPAFVLAPTHAAAPVANRSLVTMENPFWPDPDLLHAWACHLAYGQFHVDELRNGTAYRILNES